MELNIEIKKKLRLIKYTLTIIYCLRTQFKSNEQKDYEF